MGFFAGKQRDLGSFGFAAQRLQLYRVNAEGLEQRVDKVKMGGRGREPCWQF